MVSKFYKQYKLQLCSTFQFFRIQSTHVKRYSDLSTCASAWKCFSYSSSTSFIPLNLPQQLRLAHLPFFAISYTAIPCSELGAHRWRASGSSNDERISSLLAIPPTKTPCSELGAHRPRASGNSNDNRMSSLLAIP